MEENNTLPAILEEYRKSEYAGLSDRNTIISAIDYSSCRLFAAYAATEACYQGTLRLNDEEQDRVREGARSTMLEASRLLAACVEALGEMKI